jgi:hypothetical protein
VGPFSLGDWAFDGYMINLSIVISVLSLGVKIGVGTSSNCEDCAMGREGFRLPRRFLDLWWRWWRWVGLGLDLRIGIIWYWVCDLWHCQGVCYLWSWQWLRMIDYDIVI